MSKPLKKSGIPKRHKKGATGEQAESSAPPVVMARPRIDVNTPPTSPFKKLLKRIIYTSLLQF